MPSEWRVTFKGDNSSVLAKARETDAALHGTSTRVMQHNQAMARSSQTTARVQSEALTKTRTQTNATAKSFTHAEREVSRMGRGALAGSGVMRGLGRSVAFASAAFLGTAGLINVIRVSLKEATNLAGSVIRTQIVFRGAAGEVRRWSKTTFDGLGIARTAALGYANAFGQILTTLGLAPRAAAKASQDLTKIGAAISLGAGETDPTNAMKALTDGIAGRGRGLKAYGIILDTVRIKAEAMRLGLVKTTVDTAKVTLAQRRLSEAEAVLADARAHHLPNSVAVARAEDGVARAHASLKKEIGGTTVALTGQQKAEAAYSLIVQQSGRYTDKYGKLLKTSAGEQRRFTQGTRELEGELGKGLTPVFNRALIFLNGWIKSLAVGGSRHGQFVRTMGQVRKVISDAISVLKVIVKLADRLSAAVGGWENAFKLILTLYLANKFLKLSAAIRDSRLALLLLGNQAPKTAVKVVAAEDAMAAGAVTTAGKLGLIASALRGIAILAAPLLLLNALQDPTGAKHIQGVTGGNVYQGADGHWYFQGPRGGPVRISKKTARAKGAKTDFGDQSSKTDLAYTSSSSGAGFIPKGGKFTLRRRDQGRDFITTPGGEIIAPGPGSVVSVNSDPSGFGPDYPVVHFTGGRFKGATMYIGHTHSSLGAGAKFRKGQAIAYTDAKSGIGSATIPGWVEIGYWPPVGHGKIGRDPFASPKGSPNADPGSAPSSDPGSSLVVDHPSHHRSTKQRVRALRQTLDFIAKNLDEVLSPQLQKRLEQRIASIRKLLRGVVTPAELAAASKQMTSLKTLWAHALDFSQGVRNIRVTMKRISDQIERMPADARGRLRNQMAKLRAELENVTTQAGLARIRAKLAAITKAIQAAIDAAIAKADDAAGAVSDALSTLLDKSMEVFDAQTEKLVEAAWAPVRAIQAARDALDAGARKEDAQTAYQRALRLGDPQMIKEALRELYAIQLDEQEKAATAAAQAEEARIRDERRLTRERFQTRWDEIIKGNTKEGHLTQAGIDALLALMEEYGVDFNSAGDLIGAAFAQGFTDAINGLLDAVNALIDAINEVNKATGKETIPHAKPVDPGQRGHGHAHGHHGGHQHGHGMAKGGVVMRPTRTWLAEKGTPEGVIPLGDPRALAMLRQALGGDGGGETHYHLYIDKVIGTRLHDAARELEYELRRLEGRNGRPSPVVRETGSTRLGQRRQR